MKRFLRFTYTHLPWFYLKHLSLTVFYRLNVLNDEESIHGVAEKLRETEKNVQKFPKESINKHLQKYFRL